MNAMNSGLDHEADQFAVELRPSSGTRRWRTWATTSGVHCACAWYCTRSPPSLREGVAGSTVNTAQNVMRRDWKAVWQMSILTSTRNMCRLALSKPSSEAR